MNAYLDPTTLVPLLVKEASSAEMDAFIDDHDGELVVSEFAAAEVASALSRLVRGGMMTEDEVGALLTDFDVWRSSGSATVDFAASDIRLADAYVRRFALMLRLSDAVQVALCHRLELTLVTLDRRLAAVARTLAVDVTVPAG